MLVISVNIIFAVSWHRICDLTVNSFYDW